MDFFHCASPLFLLNSLNADFYIYTVNHLYNLSEQLMVLFTAHRHCRKILIYLYIVRVHLTDIAKIWIACSKIIYYELDIILIKLFPEAAKTWRHIHESTLCHFDTDGFRSQIVCPDSSKDFICHTSTHNLYIWYIDIYPEIRNILLHFTAHFCCFVQYKLSNRNDEPALLQ